MAYHRRPSEFVGLTDPWMAYQFDLAVLLRSQEDDEDGDDLPPEAYGSWLTLPQH